MDMRTLKVRVPRSLYRHLAVYAAANDLTVGAALIVALTMLIEQRATQ